MNAPITITNTAAAAAEARPSRFFPGPAWIAPLILVLLALIGLALRLNRIQRPPLETNVVRQFRSIIIARHLYFQRAEGIPEWRKEAARINKEKRGGGLEPPVLEHLATAAYLVTGAERVWLPRAFISASWVLGAVFLWLIGKRLTGPEAALLPAAFYLLLPYAINISRSFQADSLMVALALAAILLVIREHERPGPGWLAAAIIVSAICFFIKPFCWFIVIGVALALSWTRTRSLRALFNGRFLTFAIFSSLPAAAYFLLAFAAGGGVRGQAETTFMPLLAARPSFWLNWLNAAGRVVGFTALAVSLISLLLPKKRETNAVLFGLWGGYVIFGLVFTRHISSPAETHYHLQLIPIAALSMGTAVKLVMENTAGKNWKRWAGSAVAALAVFLAVTTYRQHRWERLDYDAIDRDVTAFRKIGELTGHSPSVITLADHFGKPLMYYGEVAGNYWPYEYLLRQEARMGPDYTLRPVQQHDGRLVPRDEKYRGRPYGPKERFEAIYAPENPEFFIVQGERGFLEWERQKDLEKFLTSSFPLLAESDDFLIFDLRHE